MQKAFVGLVLSFVSVISGLAADVCLGPTATGNGSGSDWSNIANWHSITFVRSNVYWLADGNYTSRTFPDNYDGFAPVTTCTLKKAIESNHGPAGGWNSSLGDGQAVFKGWFQVSSDVIIDGQTGGGPGSWKTGFGIKIDVSGKPPNVSSGLGYYCHRANISHVEVVGNYGDGDQIFPQNHLIVGGGLEGNVLSYAYVHGAGGCLILGNSAKQLTFEYTYFGYMEDTGGEHSEIMSMQSDSFNVGNGPIYFKYCIFTSAGSTGGLMMKGPMEIYGCIFAPQDGNILTGGHGVLGTWTQHDAQIKVYNCTFISLNSHVASQLTAPGDTINFRNNLVMNSAMVDADMGIHEYNHYVSVVDAPITEVGKTTGSVDPLVDWRNGNFRPSSNFATGTPLPAPYDKDMYGKTRITWTKGAIEFVGSGGPNPTPTPSPSPSPSATPSPSPSATPNPTPIPNTVVYRINGGGGAVAPFSGDQFVSGGIVNSDTSKTISVSGVTNPAPVRVYQFERYGTFSYTIPSLVPNVDYVVRLHFAELYWNAGRRKFNVILNGQQVLTSFDIAAEAGGPLKAIVKEFTTKATAAGQMLIGFVTVSDNAKLSGIEILTSNTPSPTPTPTPVPTPVPTPTPMRSLDVNSTRTYAVGTQVVITAPPAPAGYVFDKWIGDTDALANPLSAATTVTIPSSLDVTVIATYKSQ